MAFSGKFYQGGLRFACVMCGNCCQIPGGRVQVSPAEIADIARILQLKVDEIIDSFVETNSREFCLKDGSHGTCVFLENNSCRIYSARPLQCRTFPFWPENIKSHYRWKQLTSFCPGIDRGILHEPEVIQSSAIRQRQCDRRYNGNREDFCP